VGRNVSIITRSVYVDKTTGGHHAIETSYQPCTKDRKDVFLTKDGPLFKLKVGHQDQLPALHQGPQGRLSHQGRSAI
jgi:hypothetical protein